MARRAPVDFFPPLLTAFRGPFADLPELLLGGILYGLAHFPKVFALLSLVCQAVHSW